MQIHVSKDGQQLGPFTWEQVQEQLAAGTIVPTDYAWHEGLEEWAALSELKPLQETVPEMGAQSTKSNDALSKPKQHSKLKTAFGFLLLLAVLGLPLIACSFSLLDYHAVKEDGAPLFFYFSPFITCTSSFRPKAIWCLSAFWDFLRWEVICYGR